MMQRLATTITAMPALGKPLNADQLALFHGGVTAGGCVPDPLGDAMREKIGGTNTVTLPD